MGTWDRTQVLWQFPPLINQLSQRVFVYRRINKDYMEKHKLSYASARIFKWTNGVLPHHLSSSLFRWQRSRLLPTDKVRSYSPCDFSKSHTRTINET